MEESIRCKIIVPVSATRESCDTEGTNLSQAQLNRAYTIKEVRTRDEELKKFLFTLGCYKGEVVTLISILSKNYVISVKDARYSIDHELAESIMV